MGGILTTLARAADVVNVITKHKGNPSAILNELIVKENNKQQLLATDGSITRLIGSHTIEPYIICTNSITNLEIYEPVVNVSTDIFTSFFLQALDILRGTHDLDIKTSIDVLNTDNGGLTRVGRKALSLALEEDNSIDYLSLLHKDKYLPRITVDGINSSYSKNQVKNTSTASRGKKYTITNKTSTEVGYSDSMQDAYKDILYGLYIRQLKVKMETTIKKDDSKEQRHTIEIPLTVKSTVLNCNINQIVHLCKPNAEDKRFSRRWEEYRSGGISFKELLFCTDLIKEYKKNRINDSSKLMELVNQRVISANSKLSDNYIIGYEKNYNILVFTKEEKPILDAHIGGDIFKDMFKQKILEETHSMFYIILDEDYERATIGFRDMRGNTVVGYKTLSKRNKSDKPNFEELVKALLVNRTPTL